MAETLQLEVNELTETQAGATPINPGPFAVKCVFGACTQTDRKICASGCVGEFKAPDDPQVLLDGTRVAAEMPQMPIQAASNAINLV